VSRIASLRQRSSSRFLARGLTGAKPAPFPRFIVPALATQATTLFGIVCQIDGGRSISLTIAFDPIPWRGNKMRVLAIIL
jgi:hypothetical protein